MMTLSGALESLTSLQTLDLECGLLAKLEIRI